jgi:tetratricopeptide (TPR) repeat protein
MPDNNGDDRPGTNTSLPTDVSAPPNKPLPTGQSAAVDVAPVQKERRRFASPLTVLIPSLLSKTLTLIGGIFLAAAIAAGIALTLRFISRQSQIRVSAFDLLAGEQKSTPGGKVLADLLVDNFHQIIEEANRFSGTGAGKKAFRSVPDMPHIPVDTSYGLEFKGISMDHLIATWKHIRYHEFLVSGDLILGPNGDGIVRVRHTTAGRAKSFEARLLEINPMNIEAEVYTLSLELMKDMNPEVAARYLIATYLNCTRDCNDSYSAALRFCREWSKNNPKDAIAFFWLGYLLGFSKHPTDALPILDHALALDNRLDTALNTEGTIIGNRGKKGDLGESDRKYRAVLRIRSNPNAMRNLGVNALYRGDYHEAEKWFRKALHVDPEMALANLNLGMALLHQAKYKDAADAYHQVLFQRPGNFDAMYGLVLALVKNNQSQEALDLCDETVRLYPESAEVAAVNEGVIFLKMHSRPQRGQ